MTGTAAPADGGALGRALDQWLAHLDGQGFRVGVRERLLVQALLSRLAAHGELPTDRRDMLALAAPLLCGSREQQRHYARLLDEFVAGATPSAGPQDPATVDADARRRTLRQRATIGLLAGVLALAGLWQAGVFTPTPAPPPPAPVEAPPAAPAPPPQAAPALPFAVPPLALPLQPELPPRWSAPARVAAALLGALAMLGWAAAAEASRRRRMALRGLRTDDELDEHLLRDPAPVDIAPHPALARSVGRALRQHVGGDARVLDMPRSVRATVAALGAFTPRWREVRQTPEYLALVDVRHPHDHHAAVVLAQLDALARAGVALQVWFYESAPAAGCWLRGAHGNDDPLTRHRVPLATLAARGAGQRLLVFGPAEVLQHPLTGGLQPWAQPLLPLAERAWITPRPAHAWGAAERLADEAGFLVLPLQEASLVTLAGWFASRRLALALDPDTPTSVPALLQGRALDWVTRTDAPAEETRQQLLRQLRTMLGGRRFQWLCGCAIFPQLTPALTLALGRHLLPDPRALALGMAAFAVLPWFRWGRMPDWLRQALLAELSPEMRTRFAAEVHERLDRALASGDGPVLADVATRRRRLLGALQQRRGPLRDAVLADFVRSDGDAALASRLPEGLRRRLFKDGDPGAGLRPLVRGLAVAGALAFGIAVTPAWQALVGTVPQPALAVTTPPDMPGVNYAAGAGVDLRAIGETGVLWLSSAQRTGVADFAPGVIDLATQGPERLSLVSRPLVQVNTDGVSLQIADGQVQLLGPGGERLGAALALPAGRRAVAAGFTPSGGRVVALLDDGRWASWGAPWPTMMEVVVHCGDGGGVEGPVVNAVATALAQDRELAPLLVTSAAASFMNLPSPGPGELWVTRGYDVPRSERVAERVRAISVRSPLPSWSGLASAAQGGGRVLAIGACLPAQAAPVQQQAAASPLQQRVLALFAADGAERTQAAESLARDAAALSDAVAPALALALQRQQAARPVVEPALGGIYNTLALLSSVTPPATLRRESARVQQLVRLSAANDASTAQVGRMVLARLKQAEAQKSTIYLQIAGEAQRPLAEALSQRLANAGLQPAGIETIGDRAPARTEIRVQGYSDRTVARALRDAAAPYGGATLVSLPQTPANDTYEVWLGRDLCVQQVVEGCGAAPSKAAPDAGSKAAAAAPSDSLLALAIQFSLGTDGDPSTPAMDAYLDPAGYWAIGYDHSLTLAGQLLKKDRYPDRASLREVSLTLGNGQSVPVAEGITTAQAKELLRADLAVALAQVDRLVTVPLAAHQREALGDFVYNLGAGNFERSTLLRLVNAGQFDQVPAEFNRWVVAGGATRVLPTLVQRRAAEVAMWQGKDWRSALPNEASKK